MLKFDKLKIVSNLKNIIIYNENSFNKVMKNNIVTEMIYSVVYPYSLYIKIDYVNH